MLLSVASSLGDMWRAVLVDVTVLVILTMETSAVPIGTLPSPTNIVLYLTLVATLYIKAVKSKWTH